MLINNHQLHVESHGPEKAPAVILLHHGLGSTRAWRGQVAALTTAGYRVIVYDRWGYGSSDPRPHLDAPAFADDLADLHTILSTFNLQTVSLIGHSDGGTIALYYAAQNPDRVRALVAVAAHIYLEPKMEPGILALKQNFERDPRFRKGMQLAHGGKYESVFWNWFNGWHTPAALDWDLRPLLAKIDCPALIVQGENDEHAAPQHAIDIAENIDDAELWLASGVGHMLPQDISTLFNKRVLDFLKGI